MTTAQDASRKRGALHERICTGCRRPFAYERTSGRQGRPRLRCFRCSPGKSDLYREVLTSAQQAAATIHARMEAVPAYREAVDDWLDVLRRRHAGRDRYPEPPHSAAGDVGQCAPCDALRLLALERLGSSLDE